MALNYRNEASFSKAVCKCLRDARWFVQRIESGETGRGIPDIYAISPSGAAMWIELKRVHHTASPLETIPWRPGQQAWLHRASRYGAIATTLCCFDDIIWMIPHYKIYEKDQVSAGDLTDIFFSVKDMVK